MSENLKLLSPVETGEREASVGESKRNERRVESSNENAIQDYWVSGRDIVNWLFEKLVEFSLCFCRLSNSELFLLQVLEDPLGDSSSVNQVDHNGHPSVGDQNGLLDFNKSLRPENSLRGFSWSLREIQIDDVQTKVDQGSIEKHGNRSFGGHRRVEESSRRISLITRRPFKDGGEEKVHNLNDYTDNCREEFSGAVGSRNSLAVGESFACLIGSIFLSYLEENNDENTSDEGKDGDEIREESSDVFGLGGNLEVFPEDV